MSRTITKMDKAKTAIVLDHPFYASILLRHPLEARTDIPTLAVTARGKIYYNEAFTETLTVQQLVWALCHEVMHVVCQHAVRLNGRNAKKWNYAGDAFINDTLTNAKIGDPIPKTVDMPGSKDKTTDQIYNELPDEQGGGGGGGGSGDDYMDGDGMGEDIMADGPPLTESEIKEIEATTRVEVAEAAQAAKMRGKLPGALAQFVADFINVPTPWYDILERYMTAFTRGDYTWSRPNRRFIGGGDYLPSVGSVAQMGEVVVQVDVSGSVSREELRYYNGHLSRIVEQCRPSKVHVIYTDTQVQKHVEFQAGEEVAIEFYSGGGTHMPEGFDWCAREGIVPEAFVCLTDGYTDFGTDPGFPVIWCISSKAVATHGETIHFSMAD